MSDDKMTRGSSNLGPMSADDLHKAISLAKTSYKLKRWIIKGIPPVYDRIDAVIDVTDIRNTGQAVQGLVGLQTPQRQIGVVIFPYGIPVVDGALLNVDINFGAPVTAANVP
jgi:hypothetical protein